MNLNDLYFSWRIYWRKIKGLLNGLAETIILLASIASLFVLVYQFGFVQTAETSQLLDIVRPLVLLAFFTGITLRYAVRFKDIVQEKMLYLDISIYFLLFSVLSSKLFFKEAIEHSLPYLTFFADSHFVYLLFFLLSVIHLSRQTFTLMQSRIKPALLFLISFVFIILVGAGLLSLPNATTKPIAFIDALFISTTSVCVTGLTTVDVATQFTHIGHIIIMLLIQIGGIGVMTFTSFFALSFMGKSSFSSKMMLKDMLNEEKTGGLFQVIINILFVTLLIEGVGAYFIYMNIHGHLPGGTRQEFFYAIFHAVSAFCNAGISTLSGNMCDPLIINFYHLHFWIAVLIVSGGLGFPIVFNYLKLLQHLLMNGFKLLIGKQKHYVHTPRIINLHTYIVVISTLVLLIAGMGFYILFENENTLQGLPPAEKLSKAFLASATPRTAGFNVADMASLTPATLMLTLVLMAIGAAPMSTGGGLKVTVMFVTLVTMINAAREKDKVEVRRREIAPFAIRKAFATIMLYFSWVAIATWILAYTEAGAPLFSLLFEVISALSTVGLSINFTPELSMAGKIVIICTMLIGRIGVLTFLVSFCRESKKKNYSYPQENILM